MATRRLRIKAVANLPARRNRPAASHSSHVALDSSEVENKVTAVGDLTGPVSVDDISNQQKIEAVNSTPPASEKIRVLDSTSTAPLVELLTRKSVIVSAEEAARNDFHCASDVTEEKEFKSTTRAKIRVDTSTLDSSVPKSSEVNKTNVRFNNNESATTSATSVATVTVTNSRSEKSDLSDTSDPLQTQQNTRGLLRGRRLKPAVNLPAANRKRTVGDCSTPIPSSTSSLNRLRHQEVLRTNEDNGKVEVIKQQAGPLKEEHPDHGQTQSEVQLSSPPPAIANRSCTNSAPDDAVKESCPSTTTSASGNSGRRRQTSISQKAAVARRNFIKHLSKDSPPQRSSLTMFDLIFYNPSSNPMKTDGTCTPKGRRRSRETSMCSIASLQEDRLREENVDDVGNSSPLEEETAMPVPRVKVGPDGNLILDEQSLVIETTGTKKTREELERSEVVVDTGGGGHYKRTKRSKDWSDHETKKFYRALHVVGTDFSLMQPLFRSRTRRELKLKFKKEERLNPSLVNKALAQPLDFDISELEREVALEEEEERRLAEESQKKLEPSCSTNVKVIQRPKQTKKKQSKSSRKSFTSAEMCEDEPEQPPLVQLEGNEGDTNKITKSTHTKTPKPKTNTIYVENEAEADYAMLSLGIVSPAVRVGSSAVKNPKRTKAKPKIPAAKRVKEDECHEEVPSCSYKHVNTSGTPNNSACVRPAGRLMVTPGGALPVLPPTTPVSSTSTTRVVSCSSSRLLPTTPTLPRMEPGSIIVLKSPYPQHPDRHILQVYMVTNSSGNNAVPAVTPASTVPLSQFPGISPLPPPVPSLVPVTPRPSNPPSANGSDSPEKVLTCL